MDLNKLWEIVKDKETWSAESMGSQRVEQNKLWEIVKDKETWSAESMGSQRVEQNLATEQQQQRLYVALCDKCRILGPTQIHEP